MKTVDDDKLDCKSKLGYRIQKMFLMNMKLQQASLSRYRSSSM